MAGGVRLVGYTSEDYCILNRIPEQSFYGSLFDFIVSNDLLGLPDIGIKLAGSHGGKRRAVSGFFFMERNADRKIEFFREHFSHDSAVSNTVARADQNSALMIVYIQLFVHQI